MLLKLRFLLIFLCSVFHLVADHGSLIATLQNDPSVLLEGKVNALTRMPSIFEEDLVIQGAEPIRIIRSYQGGCQWNIASAFTSSLQDEQHKYRWEIWERGTPMIYKKAGEQKVNGEKQIRFECSNQNKGFANTWRGEISSRTNLKNNYFLLDKERRRFLVIHAADGSVRRYKKSLTETVYEDLDDDDGRPMAIYRLLEEHLPNGNWVFYDYKKIKYDGRKSYLLISIRTMNPARNVVYAKADFIYPDYKKSGNFFVLGSDGQTAEYRYAPTKNRGEKNGPLATRIASSGPDQNFSYFWIGWGGWDNQKLKTITYPEGRVLHLDHEDFGEQVKAVYAPAGSNQDLKLIYSFTKNEVEDSEGNRTKYRSDGEGRPYRIERYSREGSLQNADQFVWGKERDVGNLIAKTVFDAANTPVASKRYFYDWKGNVLEERFYGNLSGKGPAPVLDNQGIPLDSCEVFIKQSRYSEGTPSLLLEEREENRRTVYEYLPGTDLLSSLSFYDGQELKLRTSFEYNVDLVLIRKIEDDGFVRVIKEITPQHSGPYVNMPYILEEKFSDRGHEILLKKEVLTYTTGGRIAQRDLYDANNVLRYSLKTTYDEKGRPLTQTDALGRVELFAYDLCGNCIQSHDERITTNVSYDFSNRPTAVRKVGDDGISLESHFAYNTRSQLITETDPRGSSTSHRYDALGRCVATQFPKMVTEAKTFVVPEIQSVYDCSGNEVLKIDAEGNRTETQYNAYGKPTLIVYPDGAREEFFYNLNGTLSTHRDPSGVTESYFYDGLKNLLKKTISSPRGEVLSEETFVYQGTRLIAKTDAESNKTTYAYDGAGRKISESFDGVKTNWSYDALGRVASVQKGILITHYEYDLLDRIVEERKQDLSTEKNLRIKRTVYDSMGNPKEQIAFVAGNEVKEESRYDSLNRLIWKKDFSGAVSEDCFEEFFLNEHGQKVLRKTHTDPMGLQTIETFDAQNRVTKIEQRKEKTLSLEEKTYNRNGLCTLQINTVFHPDGSSRQFSTRWSYDPRGRVSILTEADSKITRYGYTPRGELAQTVKPDGTVLSFEYNDLGHRVKIFSSDGTINHLRVFNRLGRLIQHDDLKREVDARGNLLKESFPQGFAIESSYDVLDRKIRSSIAGHGSFEWDYNACDLLRAGRIKHGQRLYEHCYLSYDRSGNLLEERSILGESISHGVDASSRKVKIQTPKFSQEVLDLDLVGNILRMRVQGEEKSYTYDELYQLTSETGLFAHDYRYDSLYNRLQKDGEIYQINDLQQVVSHFEYDRNGNPIQQGDTRYFYDALDRLVRLEKPDLVQTFVYDSENRCLSKTTHRKGQSETRFFIYDGQNEIGAFDQNMNLRELRFLGETPHAEIGSAVALELEGSVYAPIHDLQGNVALVLGEQHTSYFYSAFGEEKVAGFLKSPWRFSSKRSDEESGLVYFGRRFYSPEFGRWLTPDPVGFADGMNLYAFVHNDPLTHFDEYGLLDFGQCNLKPQDQAAQNAGFSWGLNRFATGALQSACWFADHLSPLFTMSTPSTYFRSLGDRTTAWMEERLGKKTPAQWENPHFQNGYKSGYWGSEAATFFAMGGAGALKGLGQKGLSYFSGSASIGMELGSLATKTAQTSLQAAEKVFAKNSIWTSTKNRTSVQNAFEHWKNHGREFPILQNSKQYVEATKAFVSNPFPGTLIKNRVNGDVLFYNPSSNTFAIINKEGVPRTMYKPNVNKHPYSTNMDYFNAQQ